MNGVLFVFAHGCSQGAFVGPSAMLPLQDSADWNTNHPRPLTSRLSYAVERHVNIIIATIVHLLRDRRPSAICRPTIFSAFVTLATRIVAVVVNAVNTVVRRGARSHVLVEVLNIMPALADSDTATAPAFVVPIVGVIAPRHHAIPRLIFRGTRQAVLGGVMPVFQNCIQLQTPTAFGVSRFEMPTCDLDNLGTSALTIPRCNPLATPLHISSIPKYLESVKRVVGQILELRISRMLLKFKVHALTSKLNKALTRCLNFATEQAGQSLAENDTIFGLFWQFPVLSQTYYSTDVLGFQVGGTV